MDLIKLDIWLLYYLLLLHFNLQYYSTFVGYYAQLSFSFIFLLLIEASFAMVDILGDNNLELFRACLIARMAVYVQNQSFSTKVRFSNYY